MVSKTLGEGNDRKANAVFSQLIRICLEFGVVAGVLLIIFMEPLVVALDALFIIGFGWGLAGAAIATAIALATGGIYPLLYFYGWSRKRSRSGVDGSGGSGTVGYPEVPGGRPARIRLVRTSGRDWKSIGKSCTNGLSEYVGNVALNVVSIGYNLQLMKYIGEDGVSAYGIIMYVGFIFTAVFIGYNLCVSQVIAFNYGAGNRAELRSLLRKSLILIGLAGVMLTMVAEVAAPWLSAVFVGFDKVLCELTTHAIRIYLLSFLLCGFNMFCSAWFTALGNGVVSAMVTFILTCTLILAFRKRYLTL